MFIGNKYFERGRAKIDALQEAIRGLINGTKELKLSKIKQERYFDEILLENERAVLDNTKLANTIVVASATYGDLLSFFVIGLLAYVFVSSHTISTQTLIGDHHGPALHHGPGRADAERHAADRHGEDFSAKHPAGVQRALERGGGRGG